MVAAIMGLTILNILRFVKEEFLIVLGTSSFEAAMPTLMEKLELLGCGQSPVGLTVPLGYPFNLDGSSIYSPWRSCSSPRRTPQIVMLSPEG